MNKLEIKKMIAGGFTDREIQEKIKQEEKQIAEAKASALAIKKAQELAAELQAQLDSQDDEPEDYDTVISTDNIQKTFERTWEAIRHSGSIKDITNLTTQKDIYAAVEVGKWYKIVDHFGGHPIVECVVKTAASATMQGVSNYRGSQFLMYAYIAYPTITTGISSVLKPIQVGYPSADSHATNKQYVDGSHPVKDLTHLTTQDELYQALDVGQAGIIKIGHRTGIFVASDKSAARVLLDSIVGDGSSGLESVTIIARAGNTTAATTQYATLLVHEPIADTHATTKKYVDDAIVAHTPTLPKSITLIYDNGTTEIIKVGQ